MGQAIETIVGYVTSGTGSTTFDALSNNSNQSFVVRSAVPSTDIWLEDIYGSTSAASWLLSIKSPRLHDDVLGMEFAVNAYTNTGSTAIFNPQSLMPSYQQQLLYPTDTLSVTANATTGTNKFVGAFQVRYENLGGVDARLHHWDEIRPRIKNLVGFEVQPQASGTVGLFGSGVALNSVSSRWKANTDYAWLGYTTSIPVTAIVMQGVDVGNLYFGGPGLPDSVDTGSFFIDKSVQYNTPHIPVINSLNVGGTFVFCADITASTHPNVLLQFAELDGRIG